MLQANAEKDCVMSRPLTKKTVQLHFYGWLGTHGFSFKVPVPGYKLQRSEREWWPMPLAEFQAGPHHNLGLGVNVTYKRRGPQYE